ncbi:MAG: hypothetical protein GX829_00245 [Clostridium sp.]|nr:hypothetical protein [Clostridium sp.]
MEKELTKALSIENRADLIFRHYMKHQRQNTIGFCSSIDHAEYMAGFFRSRGIEAITIHSDLKRDYVRERHMGLEQFEKGEIQVIFAVDVLNEGVDLPHLDLLLFLRPTESPTVFLQQLGRGLRHAPNKENLKVLDFIGNYRNVDRIPLWLSDKKVENSKDKKNLIKGLSEQRNLPLGCFVDFDLEVINLFEKIIKSKVRIEELINNLYENCKRDLDHIPSRMEFFESLDEINYSNIKRISKLNPFRNFLSFVDSKENSYVPLDFFQSNAFSFIQMIETTGMQALYKIPLFLAFYNNGDFKTEINKEDIKRSFFDFYQDQRHQIDLERFKSRDNFRTWHLEKYWELALSNPIHFLTKTHGDIFEYDTADKVLRIIIDIGDWSYDPFFLAQMNDAIDFRRNQFLDLTLKR